MSKQLKLRFKKLIKKAEFMQADLEYHVEISEDAKKLFRNAINKEIESLPPAEREILNNLIREQQIREQQILEERIATAGRQQEKSEKLSNGNVALQNLEEDPRVERIEEGNSPLENPSAKKIAELRKIFYKIAALTHPDKSFAKGLPKKEIEKLEDIFKRAKKAYDEGNWYVLYTIAVDLNMEIDNISDSHLEWVEDDIQHTLSKILTISSLVAWGWYTGCEDAKLLAIKSYFAQMYGYSWNMPEPTD